MSKCAECGSEFDVEKVRAEYKAEFGADFDYDEDFDWPACALCASSETESNMNVGRAIDMVNGEVPYDADFVGDYL